MPAPFFLGFSLAGRGPRRISCPAPGVGEPSCLSLFHLSGRPKQFRPLAWMPARRALRSRPASLGHGISVSLGPVADVV